MTESIIPPTAPRPAADAAGRPEIVTAGESIAWALARERGISGLRYPGEDSPCEEPELRALGLLPDSNGALQ